MAAPHEDDVSIDCEYWCLQRLIGRVGLREAEEQDGSQAGAG